MLIEGAGKNENELFVQMMLHKRQGVLDLFNYSLDFKIQVGIFTISTDFLCDGKGNF